MLSGGRDIELAVRVPPTLADSERIGLDVAKWMADGLVDTVVAGVGWIPFEMPIGEFVEEARGTGCRIYGCLEGLRPLVDDSALRAAAYRLWRAGVDGVYLYNYYTMTGEWKQRMLPQLADPGKLERMSKRYELDHSDRIAYGGHGGAFRNAVPAAQLPVTLERTLTGRGPVLRIEIADDVESARAEGSLGSCALGLMVDGFGPNDEFEIHLNGEVLPWGSGRTVSTGGGAKWPLMIAKVSFQYDVGSPPLKNGVNELFVRLRPAEANGRKAPVLTGVEVTVTYRRA